MAAEVFLRSIRSQYEDLEQLQATGSTGVNGLRHAALLPGTQTNQLGKYGSLTT